MSDGRMEDSETTLDVGEGGASVWNNPRQLVTMGTQATFMTVTRSLSQLAI